MMNLAILSILSIGNFGLYLIGAIAASACWCFKWDAHWFWVMAHIYAKKVGPALVVVDSANLVFAGTYYSINGFIVLGAILTSAIVQHHVPYIERRAVDSAFCAVCLNRGGPKVDENYGGRRVCVSDHHCVVGGTSECCAPPFYLLPTSEDYEGRRVCVSDHHCVVGGTSECCAPPLLSSTYVGRL